MGIIVLSRDNIAKVSIKMLSTYTVWDCMLKCDCYTSIYSHTVYGWNITISLWMHALRPSQLSSSWWSSYNTVWMISLLCLVIFGTFSHSPLSGWTLGQVVCSVFLDSQEAWGVPNECLNLLYRHSYRQREGERECRERERAILYKEVRLNHAAAQMFSFKTFISQWVPYKHGAGMRGV